MKFEIVNLLEDMKTIIIHSLAMQLGTMQINMK
jgi:hypothetical protein